MSSMNSLHPRREVKPGSEIMTFQGSTGKSMVFGGKSRKAEQPR
ncbi:hypothetical protein ES319_D05G126300v1 [Gossypium barbadense]|uniref:Uncharacterized protein n=1 Tax=Gossypium barbadense TaxID=3634 RepID=A0A5J5RJI7_GOSBA|nr:hypothetical protein ES319_D05G126300v1 [Gossypium barbadense]